ncbi:hypothetical protein [Mycobacteroides abscessus]
MSNIPEFQDSNEPTATGFGSWLDTFVDEKGLDTEHVFSKEVASGFNLIPLGVVIAAVKATGAAEQAAIKSTLVRLDFVNADVLSFFDHLAGALAA